MGCGGGSSRCPGPPIPPATVDSWVYMSSEFHNLPPNNTGVSAEVPMFFLRSNDDVADPAFAIDGANFRATIIKQGLYFVHGWIQWTAANQNFNKDIVVVDWFGPGSLNNLPPSSAGTILAQPGGNFQVATATASFMFLASEPINSTYVMGYRHDAGAAQQVIAILTIVRVGDYPGGA